MVRELVLVRRSAEGPGDRLDVDQIDRRKVHHRTGGTLVEAEPAVPIVRDGCEFAEGKETQAPTQSSVEQSGRLEASSSLWSPGKVVLKSPRMMDKVFGEAALGWQAFAK